MKNFKITGNHMNKIFLISEFERTKMISMSKNSSFTFTISNLLFLIARRLQ